MPFVGDEYVDGAFVLIMMPSFFILGRLLGRRFRITLFLELMQSFLGLHLLEFLLVILSLGVGDARQASLSPRQPEAPRVQAFSKRSAASAPAVPDGSCHSSAN